jgi:hypothetical protein
MIKWLIDFLRRKLGHYLLSDEEAEEKKRDEEIARKRRELIEDDYSTEKTADDLDDGRF